MKTKNFRKYIQAQADLEVKILQLIQKITKKQPKYREFKEYLLEKLKDPERALAYLNAAFDDEDERVFLLALKNVLQAQDEDISI